MIVYDKELLENTFLLEEAKKLNDQGFVSDAQLSEVKTGLLPILKRHNNILIRIGFFILGCLLFSSLTAVTALIAISLNGEHFWITTLVYAILGFVGSEFLTKQQKQFGYGLDDAFILGCQLFFAATIGIFFESPMAGLLSLALIGFAACIRYLHTVSMLLGLIGITGAICYGVIEVKLAGTTYLPFILLFLSLLLFYAYKEASKPGRFIYHENPIRLLQGFALLLGYFSMNYLVVRELSEALFWFGIDHGHDIPFAFLFYGCTFLIPVIYIVYSLYSKDRLMLIIGSLTLGFSFYTIRFYYHVLQLEAALILAGVVLFGFAYWAIRKLRDNEAGITFKPARGSDPDILPNIEALIVNSQIDVKTPESNSKMPFGGGGFSGGGAGDGF
ncbi:hypothetical protein [Flavobacterium sp.]